MVYGSPGYRCFNSPFFLHDDEDARRVWQNPEKILARSGYTPGNIFLNIGCEGGLRHPAAKITGRSGKVIGIDRNGEAVLRMLERDEKEGPQNIRGIVGIAEETVACRGCADVIFFGIDLHDFDDPGKVLDNARLMIGPRGILVDLNWRKESTLRGPPVSIRFDQGRAASFITNAGFRVVQQELVEPWFYQLTALQVDTEDLQPSRLIPRPARTSVKQNSCSISGESEAGHHQKHDPDGHHTVHR
jgi:SAM-dependent methyltransferase